MMPEPITFQFSTGMTQGQDVVQRTFAVEADFKDFASIDVATEETLNIEVAFDPANLKAYSFLATGAALILTTVPTTGTPDVITLPVGVPIAWHEQSGLDNHFANANPITGMTVENESTTTAAVLKMITARDGTPAP
jgi:hypothetical protein